MFWLVGMMGSGKSTIGRALADAMEVPFWDSDDEVERECGQTVRTLWETRGESALRTAETEVIRRLAANRRGVVATGGGVVLDPENVTIMRSSGTVVWLQADVAELARRTVGTARPLLAGADAQTKLAELLEVRLPKYEGAAHVIFDTGAMSVPDVVEAISEATR